MIRSSNLRAFILEFLNDYQVHTTVEIRDYLKKTKGLEYKDDYTRGQLSGTLYTLAKDGTCRNDVRGEYLLIKSVKEPEIKEETIGETNTSIGFASFYMNSQRDVKELSRKLKSGVEKIRLSDMTSMDFENANRLMQLIENLEVFCQGK